MRSRSNPQPSTLNPQPSSSPTRPPWRKAFGLRRLLAERDGYWVTRKADGKYALRSQCFWCLKAFPLEKLTLDHLIPIFEGGSHEPTNLVLACQRCNTRVRSGKTSKLAEGWS